MGEQVGRWVWDGDPGDLSCQEEEGRTWALDKRVSWSRRRDAGRKGSHDGKRSGECGVLDPTSPEEVRDTT